MFDFETAAVVEALASACLGILTAFLIVEAGYCSMLFAVLNNEQKKKKKCQ